LVPLTESVLGVKKNTNTSYAHKTDDVGSSWGCFQTFRRAPPSVFHGSPPGIFVSLRIIFCIILPSITRTMWVILWQVEANSTVAQNNNCNLKLPCTTVLFSLGVVAVHLHSPTQMLLFLAGWGKGECLTKIKIGFISSSCYLGQSLRVRSTSRSLQ